MKITQRVKKAKKQCARCGGCCTGTVVPLSDGDIRVLVKATGRPAASFVRLYDHKDVDYERDREGWIQFPYGKRILGLKRRRKRCIFLDENNGCTAYLVRPMTCRTFPWMVYLTDNGRLEEVVLNRDIDCGVRSGVAVTVRRLLNDARREDSRDRAYYRKVRKWNRNGHLGGKDKFLAFLGF